MGQYDDAVKALCLLLPETVCRWLGASVSGSAHAIRHSETLSAATRQVDALISVDGRAAHHIEFQADGEARFNLRMLDYRLRLYRVPELAGTELTQHAVMLGPGTIEHQLSDGQLDYAFTVHYLRDEPVAPLLADAGLAPFAPLADHPDDAQRAQTLRAALDRIAEVSDEPTRAVLARAATDLAAIRLDRDTIKCTWEDSAMPIPSLTQRMYDEGRDEGREEGRDEGREEAFAMILRERFGPDARVPAIAHRLASRSDGAGRIITAADLDELAELGD